MLPTLSALLCLGLCLGHRMRAQADELPRPSLRAENGSLGPRGSRVTFMCRGSPGAAVYLLEKELGSGLNLIASMLRSEEAEVEFSIPGMTLKDAGTYCCRYRNESHWSELSDPLELVVTDVYYPPSLSAWPNSTVAPGQDVSLQCHSQLFHDWSALYKDGAQVTKATAQPHGQGSQANFPIRAVISAHGGMYRCYSFQSDSPHWWSAPSDPLELRVTETDTQNPEGPNWLLGLSEKYASILLGVSALLLLLLFILPVLLRRARIGNGRRGAEAMKTRKSSDPALIPMEERPSE